MKRSSNFLWLLLLGYIFLIPTAQATAGFAEFCLGYAYNKYIGTSFCHGDMCNWYVAKGSKDCIEADDVILDFISLPPNQHVPFFLGKPSYGSGWIMRDTRSSDTVRQGTFTEVLLEWRRLGLPEPTIIPSKALPDYLPPSGFFSFIATFITTSLWIKFILFLGGSAILIHEIKYRWMPHLTQKEKKRALATLFASIFCMVPLAFLIESYLFGWFSLPIKPKSSDSRQLYEGIESRDCRGTGMQFGDCVDELVRRHKDASYCDMYYQKEDGNAWFYCMDYASTIPQIQNFNHQEYLRIGKENRILEMRNRLNEYD